MSERQRVRLFQPGVAGHCSTSGRPDLDSPEQIDRMVSLFYQRILEDPLLAPVFLEVARIDLDEHLPLIAAFWKKLLLGDDRYNRHMMAKHRAVDDKMPLTGAHHERWLALFVASLDEHFDGPYTDRARHLAARIIDNLYEQLSQRR
ncbi:hypothetical protein B5T_01430 [Alloalcanivorax dieselolei B5]|uniref:Globin n=1 Tax=Alcanivorax dieselolei (strain DSM 16502 / CGMCC 1.3690 / MCCC 1A00001 / B-5) TaxID=930169 RepID=K0CDL1_ALCDB|nr:group III truncated hemoglobin [Alloalcanivorax dieselolei]AFT69712.1 hypothetical protein B5T_01430 [Alloalcanivorax dieselolei B5]GGJ86407.1 hypothetical protein GCM10007426_14420 [Alloalcanivorax dieselolei]